MNSTALLFFILSQFFKLSYGNIRFVCPKPFNPTSNHETVSYMAEGACDKADESSYEDVLTISPGPFTIRFEETKLQLGSPFRIILMENTKEPSPQNGTNSTSGILEKEKKNCLLLDHIPHNNHAFITKECSEKGNQYPLGICTGSTYYITLRIPDINCEDCTLQLQQIIPSKAGNQLCDMSQSNETGNATDCIVYSSCARIRISPTLDGATRTMDYCADYIKNLPGDWQYRPEYLFKTDQGATLSFDIKMKNLHIDIPSQTKLGLIEKVEIRQNLTVLWNDTVREILAKKAPVSLVWSNLSDDAIRELLRENLVLNIIDSERSEAGDIIYNGQQFTEGQLGLLFDSYSESGWLVSERFMGPLVEDPMAAVPAGPCAPAVKYFMASLESVHVTAHGIIGMILIENRAYITAVLHVEREKVETVSLVGPSLVGIPSIDINVSSSFSGVLMTALDLTKQIPYLNTVKFLRTVKVKTDKEKNVLEGDFEEGMFAVLRDEHGHVRGMGSFQFTQGQWLQVDIVLNDITPTILSVLLLGPDDTVLADLSRETIHCTESFCCVQHLIQELSSQLILHLMRGQVMVYVATVGRNVTGKILGSPSGYCNMVDGACQDSFYQFSLSGMGIEDMKSSNGEMEGIWQETAAYVLDRANVFHYCVQVDNANWRGQNYSLNLVKNEVKIEEMMFTQLNQLSHSYLACNNIPLDENASVLSTMAVSTQREMNLILYDGHKKFLKQQLPSVFRGKCIVDKIHVVGNGHSYWSEESVPIPDIFAVVSDSLKFITEKNTSVYLMANEKAYQECQFTSAIQLSVETVVDKQVFIHSLNHPGKLYFAEQISCNTSKPLKVKVHVIDGIKTVQDGHHNEWCHKSMYSVWRDEQLKTWNQPEVSGPILIGLLIGLASGGVFLAWQGARMKRFSETFRGHNDNVFVRF
ncbi:uncharacterized protein LOC106065565 isoform X1 [Biomphalaria glabrata]|uniref:Uncharacterized protein LOC106065565 isoform X1 n=1 Tax=Biomphalaria glabrata TaxID=6526 RepID=A0A9W2ZZ56_BIOGL|nr:uncharacterized protein LOC106065565 isoform X1 [Biomphalaria glabrata]